MPHQKLIRVLNYVWLLVVFPVAVAILVGVLGHSVNFGFKTFLLIECGMAVLSPLLNAVISVHKCLQIRDLCKELAFGNQCANAYSGDLYNCLEVNVLCHQFLEREATLQPRQRFRTLLLSCPTWAFCAREYSPSD